MAYSHKEKFARMITSMRKELDAEELPLIIGELSENIVERAERIKIINRQYHELSRELPVCAVASAKGLALKADNLHFDSKSLREFGCRYFEEYRKLVEKS